jgi:hypothetical protein
MTHYLDRRTGKIGKRLRTSLIGKLQVIAKGPELSEPLVAIRERNLHGDRGSLRLKEALHVGGKPDKPEEEQKDNSQL